MIKTIITILLLIPISLFAQSPMPTLTPAPTQINLPTWTPAPTQIILPTWTSAPTQIVIPTWTPAPTQIVIPTWTPEPTQIIIPTWTPAPTPTLVPITNYTTWHFTSNDQTVTAVLPMVDGKTNTSLSMDLVTQDPAMPNRYSFDYSTQGGYLQLRLYNSGGTSDVSNIITLSTTTPSLTPTKAPTPLSPLLR